jgi:hypothetical protein
MRHVKRRQPEAQSDAAEQSAAADKSCYVLCSTPRPSGKVLTVEQSVSMTVSVILTSLPFG